MVICSNAQSDPNSFYIIDCARVFPPVRTTRYQKLILQEAVTRSSREGSHLYYFLVTFLARYQILNFHQRPELVKSNEVPLSSDAFTNFSQSDPNKAVHNQEVKEGTARLHQVIIPEYAKRIDEIKPEKLHILMTTENFHRYVPFVTINKKW